MAGLDAGMDSVAIRVADATDAAHARRTASGVARRLGFNEEQAGRVALVTTEAATNVLRHGGGGELLVSGMRHAAGAAVEIIALDKGPGMADVARSMRDGYSTAGGAGTGLGAIERLSLEFDIHSQPGKGTALLARILAGSAAADGGGAIEVGGVAVPMAGEEVCGDTWSARAVPGGFKIMVADGLGHGPSAGEASRRAADVFEQYAGLDGEEIMQRIHGALRPTRGASVALAGLYGDEGVVRYTGVGNISGAIVVDDNARRQMISYPGTAGHEVHRIHQFSYVWPGPAIVVLHSDGVVTHWSLDGYRDLLEHSPTLIAAVLYRDFSRGRDDATVVVARRRRAS